MVSGEENVPQSHQVKMDPWTLRFGRRGPSTLSPSKGSSPVLTPRRHGQSMDENDFVARRYEPAEGSASTSPPLVETPPYLRWAENLHYLLTDPDGVELFEKYLEQENCSHLLKVRQKHKFCDIFLLSTNFYCLIFLVLVCLRRPQTKLGRRSRKSCPNYPSHL
jgi:hypothetical protein